MPWRTRRGSNGFVRQICNMGSFGQNKTETHPTLSRQDLSPYNGANNRFGTIHDPCLLAGAPLRHGGRNRCASHRHLAQGHRPGCAPQDHPGGQPSRTGHGRHLRRHGRLRHPVRRACHPADRIRARLGSRQADGGALLRRHQPLHRRRLCGGVRAQSPARRNGDRTRPLPMPASCRWPIARSAATAAWWRRSIRSVAARWPTRARRSGSTWNRAEPPAPLLITGK